MTVITPSFQSGPLSVPKTPPSRMSQVDIWESRIGGAMTLDPALYVKAAGVSVAQRPPWWQVRRWLTWRPRGEGLR